ncbi:MAG: 50S ribosomal protein L10 [Elusimicrobia bacterium]|nr:50S ribosomal protein L10 [Elusimicrobiota bacterium]
MKITKKDKIEISKKLSEEFKSKDIFFAAFQGLKFQDMTSLRENLRNSRAKFRVIRNTIISHAIENAGLSPQSSGAAKGPTAVVTLDNSEEITKVAKIVADFAKKYPALKIKGGFASNKWISADDCLKFSKIGSKQEVLTQLAGILYSNLSQIRFVLEAPMRDLAYVLEALKEKKSKEIN